MRVELLGNNKANISTLGGLFENSNINNKAKSNSLFNSSSFTMGQWFKFELKNDSSIKDGPLGNSNTGSLFNNLTKNNSGSLFDYKNKCGNSSFGSSNTGNILFSNNNTPGNEMYQPKFFIWK